MSINVSYDNEWTITASNVNATFDERKSTKGVFLGNGKIGVIPSLHELGTQNNIIAIDFDTNEYGLYRNNIIDNFDTTHIRIFDNKLIESVSQCEFVQQSLDMFTGISSTTFNFINTSNSKSVEITSDMYPARNMPYTLIQTLSFTAPDFIDSLDIYHEILAKDNLTEIEYNNNTLFNEILNPDKGLYLLCGKGYIKSSRKLIATASCYLFESSEIQPIGFNVYKTDVNSCFQKLRISDMAAGSTYKMHIITTSMTEYDFKNPIEEVKRISINIANKINETQSITRLRELHIKSWYDMWKCNISIDPKLGITNNEEVALNNVKRVMRYGLYNIWCSVREGISTEINPMTLSMIDNQGSLFWDGDLWFIPLLILFRPDIAKCILESRYRTIDKAIQLAAGYGYNGSKYPYVNDVIGYGNAPYWDTSSVMHIFNTALVSINVWNYYRVTLDKDWLLNKGYVMLKNNADFFYSRIEIDESGLYNLNDVYAFHDSVSSNNSMTNYLIKTAFKFAIEASYELNIVPKEDWLAAYFNIEMEYFIPGVDNVTSYDVIKLDKNTTDANTCKFVETLVPITPYYSEVFFKTDYTRTWESIKKNYEHWSSNINPSFQDNPMNKIVMLWLKGYMCNYDPASYIATDNFQGDLDNVINTNSKGLWGNFNMSNKDTEYNDQSLNALFILSILTSFTGLKVTGSVSETRFYNESMGVRVESTACMPKTWKSIKLTGILGKNTYNILNTEYYN